MKWAPSPHFPLLFSISPLFFYLEAPNPPSLPFSPPIEGWPDVTHSPPSLSTVEPTLPTVKPTLLSVDSTSFNLDPSQICKLTTD
ncbi:Uncharacterized protein TCM_039470 [Theobroma cacao]|uniref:Uncharacterized protein n=1 Tax=Theobroma cacao TaxID=3641 RepID=A0A061GRM0_THECC|nr:Uncharacterized protein TCM_039470 [Theobroma cacao]